MKWISLILFLTSCSSYQQSRSLASSEGRVLQVSEKIIQLHPLTCHGCSPQRKGCSIEFARLKTILNDGSFVGIESNETYYGVIEVIEQKNTFSFALDKVMSFLKLKDGIKKVMLLS